MLCIYCFSFHFILHILLFTPPGPPEHGKPAMNLSNRPSRGRPRKEGPKPYSHDAPAALMPCFFTRPGSGSRRGCFSCLPPGQRRISARHAPAMPFARHAPAMPFARHAPAMPPAAQKPRKDTESPFRSPHHSEARAKRGRRRERLSDIRMDAVLFSGAEAADMRKKCNIHCIIPQITLYCDHSRR